MINMLIRAFFSGMFLFNSLPHLVKGIAGEKHMTPFKRVSSPSLNIIWAFANIAFGVLILGLDATSRLNALSGTNCWAFLAGGFIMSLLDAQLFGKPDARLPWHKD